MKLSIRLFFVLVILFCPPLKGAEDHRPLEVMVKNVGQGNCIIVKFPQDNDPMNDKIMLVDCGSTSFKNPLKTAVQPKTPLKKSTYRRFSAISTTNVPKQQKGGNREEIIRSIQEYIGDNLIKTVVVTHPDKDHYGWIPLVLSRKNWQNCILGGLPEKYLENTRSNKPTKIGNFLRENSKRAHFAAIEGEVDFTEIPQGKYLKAPPQYDGKIQSLKNAFNFGDRYEVQVLAVNSNHVQSLAGLDEEKIVINMSLTEDGEADHNTDSIIIKIMDNKAGKSILLTGDATGITTTRLMDYACYTQQLDFLKADVLVASHHGSSSNGTNNDAWIQSVKPEYVIISTGGLHGHPTKKAYQSFHHQGLAKVAPHSVFVGGISEGKAINHITTAGIFSTLPHGDIKIVFPEPGTKEIKIMPENSRTLVFTKLSKAEEIPPGTKGFETDTLGIKSMPSGVEDAKSFNSIDDIPDPENYGEIMDKFQRATQQVIAPIIVDLNDPKNQFILDYFSYKNIQVDEQVVVKLTIRDNLVGTVSMQTLDQQEEAGLVIDLKDPRNLYLARTVNPIQPQTSNTTATTTTTTTATLTPASQKEQKEKPSSSEEELREKKEPKKHKYEVKYNTNNIKKFVKYLLHQDKKLSEISNKINEYWTEKGEKDSITYQALNSNNIGKGPRNWKLVWNALKEVFKQDFEEWVKAQETQ